MSSIQATTTPIVEMRNIHKRFGAVHALRGVDLALYPREILGLVGDNAAGKSTLMKILSGAYLPTEGEIYLNGQIADIHDPEDSRRLGIEMVYQDFALCNNLDVASNVFLGREIVRWQFANMRWMNRRAMESGAREMLDRLRINISSVRLKVENLSGGQRQAVAIGRSTAFNAKVIIMDEPTAALSVVRHRSGTGSDQFPARRARRVHHHYQPPPGRHLPRWRPHRRPAPRAKGCRPSRRRRHPRLP